jgi:hypothetical protein
VAGRKTTIMQPSRQMKSISTIVPAPRPPPLPPSSHALHRSEHNTAKPSKDLWIAENAALARESREADRELLRLISAHATAVGSSAAALSNIFADASGLIEASKLEVKEDRKTILSSVRDLRNSVTALSSRISEAAAADAATTEYHDPSLRIARVKQVTNAAEFVSTSFKAFREKQKKAYIRLSDAESQLTLELAEFEKILAKDEADTAAEIEAKNAQERDIRGVKAVKADMAAESAARGAAELAAAASDSAAFSNIINPSSTLSPLHSVAAENEDLMKEHLSAKIVSSGIAPTVPALRARIAAIDDEVEKLGGLTGGWREDDHATFKASLTVFLSQRGRPHVLSVRHSAAYFEEIEEKGGNENDASKLDKNFRLVLPSPLMDDSESHTFLARLSSLLPYVGNDKLRDHLKWFSWFRERQAEKLGIADLWRRISKKADTPNTVSNSDGIPKNESNELQNYPKGSTPEIRIAVATWRAKKEEEKRRANAERLAKAREDEVKRMMAEREKREQLNERINEWHAGGGGAREVEIAVHLPPPPKPVDARILKQRAATALSEAARVRRELDAAKKAVEIAALKRLGDPSRSGLAGSASAVKFLSPSGPGSDKSTDVFAFWSSLPADPARPTNASHARETKQTDLEARLAQKKNRSAHEQVVASTAVKSKGRDFSFGGRSSLPSLKTPSWRKGV